MNLYVDMGANWANTLNLGRELFPGRDTWLTVAFEASPLIQPFLEQYVRYINGERSDEPTTCVPRSGSTPHLRLYANKIGCAYEKDEDMRKCMWNLLEPHLIALKNTIEPKTSTLLTLIKTRLQLATRSIACSSGCLNYTLAIPAAVGTRERWVHFWGSPMQLIRGGAKETKKSHRNNVNIVRSIDIVSWLNYTARKAAFVFLKIDIEGAEHAVLRRMEELGVHRFINAIALECHDFEGMCISTLRRIHRWNVTIIDEKRYNGMDAITAAKTNVPKSCIRDTHIVKHIARRSDKCRIARLHPEHSLESCAVVGSAPSLIYLHQGREIDSHAYVFRTNSHSTGRTVGYKTTHRIAANAFQLGSYRRQNHAVQQLVVPESWSISPGNLVTEMDNVSCIPDKTMREIYKTNHMTFGRQTLSTGGLGLGLALKICKSVSIFGFDGMQNYDHVIRDDHHAWQKERNWINDIIKSKRVIDHTARGVHLRKCESAALVRDALTKLHNNAYIHMERKEAMEIEHLLQEAHENIREGCP